MQKKKNRLFLLVKDEVIAHLPYAIFSVSLSIIIISFLTFNTRQDLRSSLSLFHSLHFLHFIFSSTGTVLAFRKYSSNAVKTVLVGLIAPAIFCTFSDAILPFWGGKILNLPITFHWCLIQHPTTVLPFLLGGIFNGWIISTYKKSNLVFYSAGTHFFHIFVSSMASILYLVSFGFANWADNMGMLFLFLLLVVMIPCTFSDIIVPIFLAKLSGGEEKNVEAITETFCCSGKKQNENDSI